MQYEVNVNSNILIMKYRNGIEEGFYGNDFMLLEHKDGDLIRYGLARPLRPILPTVFNSIDIIYYKNPLYDPNEENSFWYNTKAMFLVTLSDHIKFALSGVFSLNNLVYVPIKQYKELYPLTYTITYYHSYERRISSGHSSLISCMSETVSTGSDKKIYCSGWIYSVDLEGNVTLSYEDQHYPIKGLSKIEHSRYCYFLLIITTDTGVGVLGPLGWLIQPTYNKIECFDWYSNSKPEDIEHINECKFFICDGEIVRINFTKFNRDKTIDSISVEIGFTPGDRYRYCVIEEINCQNYIIYEDLEATKAHPYKERKYYAHSGNYMKEYDKVKYPSLDDYNI